MSLGLHDGALSIPIKFGLINIQHGIVLFPQCLVVISIIWESNTDIINNILYIYYKRWTHARNTRFDIHRSVTPPL
jgi:hypothetical protein